MLFASAGSEVSKYFSPASVAAGRSAVVGWADCDPQPDTSASPNRASPLHPVVLCIMIGSFIDHWDATFPSASVTRF